MSWGHFYSPVQRGKPIRIRKVGEPVTPSVGGSGSALASPSLRIAELHLFERRTLTVLQYLFGTCAIMYAGLAWRDLIPSPASAPVIAYAYVLLAVTAGCAAGLVRGAPFVCTVALAAPQLVVVAIVALPSTDDPAFSGFFGAFLNAALWWFATPALRLRALRRDAEVRRVGKRKFRVVGLSKSLTRIVWCGLTLAILLIFAQLFGRPEWTV